MTKQAALVDGVSIFTEMGEFAGFSAESQRFILRSLEIASGGRKAIERWSEEGEEPYALRAQANNYQCLDRMRKQLGRPGHSRSMFLLTQLVELSAFDLDCGDLDGFAPYRFLYERLLGGRVRPWLPSAFSAAVMMPYVKPLRRVGLLNTFGDALVAPLSEKEPSFRPERIAA